MPKPYNSRTHQTETSRQLIIGAAIITLLIGLTFVAFQYGQGALFFALGVFGLIAIMIGLAWLALKLIEWVAGKDE